MNKKLSNEQKLNQIKEDHRQLLTKVKESIEQNRDAFLDSITDVMGALNYDEHEVKKYEALIKAKQLIEDLVNQILNATTVEEVVNLRNRLNYYINKIKKEIVSRHLNDEMLTNYQEKSAYLRKDIAKVIRVLKRDNNIDEIDSLVSKESLLGDEKTRLNRLMTNEKRFNQYYLNPKERKKASVIEKTSQEAKVGETQLAIPGDWSLTVPKQELLPVEDLELFLFGSKKPDEEKKPLQLDDLNLSFGVDDDLEQLRRPFEVEPLAVDSDSSKKDDKASYETDESLSFLFEGIPSRKEPANEEIDAAFGAIESSLAEYVFENAEDYLTSRARSYERQYGIWPLHEYGSSRLANFCKFFANIPANIRNKRMTRVMIDDCNIYYNGSDIISFIAYTRKRNSVWNALKSIFSRSYLESFEGQCLNNHERCAEWLENYCNEKELCLGYFKKARVI